MTKPREKTREELTAEIEDSKKKIRQYSPPYHAYSNNPTISFYDMMTLKRYKSAFSSFTMFSTDVDFGCEAELMYSSSRSPFRK